MGPAFQHGDGDAVEAVHLGQRLGEGAGDYARVVAGHPRTPRPEDRPGWLRRIAPRLGAVTVSMAVRCGAVWGTSLHPAILSPTP